MPSPCLLDDQFSDVIAVELSASLAQQLGSRLHIINTDVVIGRGRPPVTEQASRDMQALAVHDRVRSVRVAQIVQTRILHNPSHVALPDPERMQVIRTQRPVPLVARKHPLPGRRFGEADHQLPRRLAEQNVPRSRLRVNQGQAVGLDFAPPRRGDGRARAGWRF